MFVNPTEIFDNTGMNGIHSDADNEISGGDDAQTSTHSPMAMTLQATSTFSIEESNRLFVATDGSTVEQHHQFIVPNESMVTSHNGSMTNVTSSYSISNKSSTILSHDNNNRNSSNTSFSNVKFTTMKPCKIILQSTH